MKAHFQSASGLGLLLSILITGPASSQELVSFELRWAEAGETAKLVAMVGEREVNVAVDVLRVWRGWHPSILLYVERLPDRQQRISYFNAITGERRSVTTEREAIVDVTVAQLDARHPPVLVLFLRNRETGDPGLALADPETGVYRRDAMATAGAILNNTIVIRYLHPGGSPAGKVPTSRSAVVPLTVRYPSPAATYVSRQDTVPGVTLTVRQNGTVTLGGLPQHRKSPLHGNWNESASTLSVAFDGTSTAEWRITEKGLEPVRWDPQVLGDRGLSFTRRPLEPEPSHRPSTRN